MSTTAQRGQSIPPLPGDLPGKTPVGRLIGVVKAYPMGNREYLALFEDRPAPKGQASNVADISKAEKDLGYCPALDLEQGLRRCIDYYMAQPEEFFSSLPEEEPNLAPPAPSLSGLRIRTCSP